MKKIEQFFITRDVSLREAMSIINNSGFGLLLLNDANGAFQQTVTDGDLRRLLLSGADLDHPLHPLPFVEPIILNDGYNMAEALELMNLHAINYIPVINKDGLVMDILDRKDIDEHILLSTPHMGDSEKFFVEEAFKTNWIAPIGPNVDAFEVEMAESVGIRYAAALSSGTAALHLALCVLDVKQGDKVFCSTFTFAASANPIVYQGAEPVFIDSEEESWNMCANALRIAFNDAKKNDTIPKAVIVVNLYGQSANMDEIISVCDEYNVPVVEDAAESLGASYKKRASGTIGKLGVYSFNGNKIITTSGGGMLISDDESLIAKARFLATQAREPELHYEHKEIGYNYRMSNILAGVGRGQLKVLHERVEARRNIFYQYKEALQDVPSIQWMPEPEWSYSNRWLTTCVIDPSKTKVTNIELIENMASELIEARPLWKPMHRQPIFSKCHYFKSCDRSISDDLFKNGICLPSGSNMGQDQIDKVINVLKKKLVK